MQAPLRKNLDPKTCLHGNPISDENGSMAAAKFDALSTLENGQNAFVTMIPDESTEVLRYVSTLGMIPGAKIFVLEKAPFKGLMFVKAGGNSYPISLDVASGIFVASEK